MSDLAALTQARALINGGARFEYFPDRVAHQPGGDLDEPGVLSRVLASAASGPEVMLLCVGGDGSMRMGANLVMNMAALGLHHMLLFAPSSEVCQGVWDVLPSVACVWQPSAFLKTRPHSLYNTQFSPMALSFFEARKILLEKLVLSHRLNVLHLDADVAVLANP